MIYFPAFNGTTPEEYLSEQRTLQMQLIRTYPPPFNVWEIKDFFLIVGQEWLKDDTFQLGGMTLRMCGADCGGKDSQAQPFPTLQNRNNIVETLNLPPITPRVASCANTTLFSMIY